MLLWFVNKKITFILQLKWDNCPDVFFYNTWNCSSAELCGPEKNAFSQQLSPFSASRSGLLIVDHIISSETTHINTIRRILKKSKNRRVLIKIPNKWTKFYFKCLIWVFIWIQFYLISYTNENHFKKIGWCYKLILGFS